MLYLISLSMIIDLIIIIVKKIIRKEYKYHVLYLIAFCISLIACIYGKYNMFNVIETNYTVYTEKDLKKDLKVLLLADMHYGSNFKEENLDNLMNKLNKINDLDMIILSGDIVEDNTSKKDMNYVFKTLGKLNTKYGIYYVYGNHDRQNYSNNRNYTTEELNKSLSDNNIIALKDNVITLDNNVTIVGREDKSALRKTIDELITDDIKNSYIIVADHQPTEYNEVANEGGNLILSGHTHGGQIFPLGHIIDLVKTSDLSYGHVKLNNLDAVVTAGVSGWGYPVRTQHHSEYVIINVKEK